MGPNYIQMGLLKVLPDTPLSRDAEAMGYLHCSEPPYSALANRWLGRDDLAVLYWFGECVERFHNNRYFVSLRRYLRASGENIARFFQDLLALCRCHGFFQLAATQELMCRLLCLHLAGRDDEGLVLDLLRYDWLRCRCGHRFLPLYLTLKAERKPPEATRDRLYKTMPATLEGVYDLGSRNHFFRKAFCLRISVAAARNLALSGKGDLGLSGTGDGIDLCFIAREEDSLFRFNQVITL